MFISIVLLIVGFIVLIKGADIFVDGASNLARNFKLSKMFIGLTIVAFGTSAPEFAVSVKSILSGNGDIVLGNVIGSNILNILLILGSASMIHDLNVKNNTVKKELPIVLMLTSLLVVLMSDNFLNRGTNILTRSDGIVLILFFGVFIYYLISMMRNKKNNNEEFDEEVYPLIKSIAFTIVGIVSVVIGSDLVVNHASNLAKIIGVSERLISLTIIALGTSLPELVTSVVATKKGEYDIAIGNVVGSNIFNIGMVLGIPISIFGAVSVGAFSFIDILFFFASAFVLFILSINDYKIKRSEGVFLLLMFIVYYTCILI